MVTSSVPPTVQGFLTILVGRLTQYDKKLETKGQSNLYRLGLWFAAKEKVESRLKSQLDESTPKALGDLKAALGKEFLVNDMPPVKAVVKMVDEYLTSGKAPKYAAAWRLVARYYGVKPLATDPTQRLVARYQGT